MSEGWYIVTYSCMCHAYVRPGQINDATNPQTHCGRHRRMVSVKHIVPSWWYSCYTCKLSRVYGVAPVYTHQKAAAHAEKFPGHKVTVYCGDRKIYDHRLVTVSMDDLRTMPVPVQLALPLEDPTDPPPF